MERSRVSEKIEANQRRLKSQHMQSILSNSLKIIHKFEKSELNYSKLSKERKLKYKHQVDLEEEKIHKAKAKVAQSLA